MPSHISIGCQSGGPEAGVVGRIKVPFYHALTKHVTSSHCTAIDEYAIVLRVDGSLDKFGEEGITRVRFAKKQRYITADIQIPEAVWQPLSEIQLKNYLIRSLIQAVAVCVTRLKKDGFNVDDATLNSEIQLAANEFLGSAATIKKG
jgi:hypothetical protein